MRFTALGVILALGVLLGLGGEKTSGAAQKPQPRPAPVQPRPIPQPIYLPPLVLPGLGGQLGGVGGGVRPPNYRPNPNPNPRPGPGMKMVTLTANYTVSFNSDMGKVRTVVPPEEFDDKGEIKKHNAEDLKRLKGDDPAEKKLPGYKSEFAELQVNDVVQVAVSSWRTTKPAPPKKGKKGKDAEEEVKEDALDKNPKKDDKDGKWVMVGALYGTVTRIDAANSENSNPKIVVKVQAQVMRFNNAPGGNDNTNTTIDPEKAQVTLILIAPRPGANLAGAGGYAVPGKKRAKKDEE